MSESLNNIYIQVILVNSESVLLIAFLLNILYHSFPATVLETVFWGGYFETLKTLTLACRIFNSLSSGVSHTLSF